jgi:hypothetical protein
LAFAKEVRTEFEMIGGGDWKKAAIAVAQDLGLRDLSPWVNRVRQNGRH